MLKKVLKGDHLSCNDFTIPHLSIWGSTLIKRVRFTYSCRYTLDGADQKDWNKLFGIGFGFLPLSKQWEAHYNSARWGWRYNPETDKIELSPYLYTEGLRLYAENMGILCASINIMEEYEVVICPIKSAQKVHYVILRDDEVIYSALIPQQIPSLMGWEHPLYFGGNKVAPHDIKVFIA